MEKIKITKEQEEALLLFIDNEKDNDIFYILNLELGNWSTIYKPLNKFSIESFSFLLNSWYEVEQPFKVGDWAYNLKYDYFVKIESVGEETLLYKHDNGISVCGLEKEFIEQFEKVTEPWKIALLNIGRSETKLQIGDAYIDNRGSIWLIDNDQFLYDYAINDFEEGNVVKYFPHEIGIEL